MASIKDVAERAGVSIASVSRVLNLSKPVAPETRARVLNAVRELNYSIDQRARALRLQKSSTLGLIVADVANPFFGQVIRTIEAVTYRNGHDLFLCNSDEDVERETFHLQAMRSQRIGGIILLPVSFSGASIAPLLKNDIPVVCLDRRVDDFELDVVLVDNRAGGRMAAQALFDAGHRRIAVVGASRTTPGRDRLTAFRDWLKSQGVDLAPELVREGNYREPGGYKETLATLSLPEPPTAIFCVNHPMTLGAFGAIRDMGLSVPKDISLIGFDDPSWAPFLDPPLTTIAQPTDQLGMSAAEMLIDRVAKRYTGAARSVMLQPRFMQRGSIGRVR